MRSAMSRVWLLTAGALGLPPLVFWLLGRSPNATRPMGSGTFHFVGVSAVAATALALALAVLWAARTLPDARTFFLALGFLSMATVFLAHGVGTGPFFGGHHIHGVAPAPAAVDGVTAATAARANPYAAFTLPTAGHDHVQAVVSDATALARGRVVGFSARLSLLLSALCFALATVDFGRRTAAFLLRWRGPLGAAAVALLSGYLAAALLLPRLFTGIPMESAALS